MKLIVLLPTYNEAENLPILIPQLIQNTSAHVLIIDDDSPDGTGEVAEALAREYNPRVEVLHRRGVPRGLGMAYADGFEMALRNGADLTIGMDADLSHSPQYIPVMIKAMKRHGYDIVVGSRYIEGGGIEGKWGWERRLLSWGAQLYARTILGLKTHDLTGAFRCYNRRALQALDFGRIRLDSFSFLIDIIYQAERSPLKVGEVPIVFRDREYGTSKVSFSIIIKSLIRVISLRLSQDR